LPLHSLSHPSLVTMKLSTVLGVVSTLIGSSSAHYIFTNINGNSAAVRQPVNNSPVTSVTSADVRCNSKATASDIVKVAAGGSVSLNRLKLKHLLITKRSTLQLTFGLDNTFYHQGPAAIYMAKAPSDVASFDGSGSVWFKYNFPSSCLAHTHCANS
jgi:hypothetical protein